MLITRKSRKPSDDSPFRSRFRSGDGAAFALRQYMRAREEVYQRVVVTAVQAVFAVFLLLFARTLHQLFSAHGRDLSNWVEIVCQGVLLLVVGVVIRRVVRNIREIRELRQELKALREDSADELGLH